MAITRIAYLGDSLTDSDEFWTLSQQLLIEPLPDQDYYSTQFSNGEVHADILSRLLGLDGSDPYNYAFAGARAVGSLTAGEFVDDPSIIVPDADPALLQTDINLTAQTDRLLADAETNGWDLSGFAVHVWIGVNDLANWTPDSIWPWRWDNEIDDLVKDIVAEIEKNVTALTAAGVGEIWVATQPDETFFPVFNEASWLIELLSDGVIDDLNNRLEAMVADFQTAGAPVRLLDIQAMTAEIEFDSTNFGFRTIEEPILLTSGSDYDPQLNPDLWPDFDFATDADQVGFIDYVHPTEAMHGVLAIYQAEAMATNLIALGSGSDTVTGTSGDDLVLASRGHDTVTLGGGDDVALGGTGNDRVEGNAGSDLIAGGAGRDTLLGGNGHDLLTGGRGDDDVDGGAGEDLIVDTGGGDSLDGGRDDDWFLWFDPALSGAATGFDQIDGGRGKDSLIFYLADTETFDAAMADYGNGRGKKLMFDSIGVKVSGVESIEFVDLSVTGLELPATGNPDLDARLAEADLWGFV